MYKHRKKKCTIYSTLLGVYLGQAYMGGGWDGRFGRGVYCIMHAVIISYDLLNFWQSELM